MYKLGWEGGACHGQRTEGRRVQGLYTEGGDSGFSPAPLRRQVPGQEEKPPPRLAAAVKEGE